MHGLSMVGIKEEEVIGWRKKGFKIYLRIKLVDSHEPHDLIL